MTEQGQRVGTLQLNGRGRCFCSTRTRAEDRSRTQARASAGLCVRRDARIRFASTAEANMCTLPQPCRCGQRLPLWPHRDSSDHKTAHGQHTGPKNTQGRKGPQYQGRRSLRWRLLRLRRVHHQPEVRVGPVESRSIAKLNPGRSVRPGAPGDGNRGRGSVTVPDSGKSGAGAGARPRFPANRGRAPVRVPGPIGDGDGGRSPIVGMCRVPVPAPAGASPEGPDPEPVRPSRWCLQVEWGHL
jgi:hypothetical protein